MLASLLVLQAPSTTKGYVRAVKKRQSISYLFHTKVMKPQNSSKSTKFVWTHTLYKTKLINIKHKFSKT